MSKSKYQMAVFCHLYFNIIEIEIGIGIENIDYESDPYLDWVWQNEIIVKGLFKYAIVNISIILNK